MVLDICCFLYCFLCGAVKILCLDCYIYASMGCLCCCFTVLDVVFAYMEGTIYWPTKH